MNFKKRLECSVQIKNSYYEVFLQIKHILRFLTNTRAINPFPLTHTPVVMPIRENTLIKGGKISNFFFLNIYVKKMHQKIKNIEF